MFNTIIILHILGFALISTAALREIFIRLFPPQDKKLTHQHSALSLQFQAYTEFIVLITNPIYKFLRKIFPKYKNFDITPLIVILIGILCIGISDWLKDIYVANPHS